MIRKYMVFGFVLLFILYSSVMPIYALTLDEIYDEHKHREATIYLQYQNDVISKEEFDQESARNYVWLWYMQSTHPEVAFNVLSKQDTDTAENRATAKSYLDGIGESAAWRSELMQYYADSKKMDVKDVTEEPVFTFSEALPMCDEFNLLSYGEGVMHPEYLTQYVAGWIFVAYADGEPFAMFQLKKGDMFPYKINRVYPSPENAAAYHSILENEGCYVTSGISDADVIYGIRQDDKIKSVAKINVETGKTKMLARNSLSVEIYYRARKEAMDHNLELQSSHTFYEMAGQMNQEKTISYKDVWLKVCFDLYIRPYLIPAVAVLALGAAVLIVIRKRKQNKA